MFQWNDPNYLKQDQYRNQDNLAARIQLHQKFTVSEADWMPWVFDHLLAHLPDDARILEIGCGNGLLWAENIDRVPPGWHLTLIDISPGMLADCQAAIGQTLAGRAVWQEANAVDLPFDADSFDGVIANHMLYHVPDLGATLSGIRRVLKPGGTFFAATNGVNHMYELDQLLLRYALADGYEPGVVERPLNMRMTRFRLQTGEQPLREHFESVTRHTYDSRLDVTDADDLMAYIRSMSPRPERNVPDHLLERLYDEIRTTIRENGTFTIQKDTGMFISR